MCIRDRWVPETRVNSTSKSIFDNSIVELRNSSVNKKLQNCTRRVNELKLCVKSLAPINEENSRIKSQFKVLNSKIDQLKVNNSVLSGELQEMTTSLWTFPLQEITTSFLKYWWTVRIAVPGVSFKPYIKYKVFGCFESYSVV